MNPRVFGELVSQPPDFMIGGPDADAQLSYWAAPTPDSTGLVTLEKRRELPSDDLTRTTHIHDVEVAARLITADTPLKPYFEYMGYRATYERVPAANGQPEQIRASIELPHLDLRNQRRDALPIAEADRPPRLKPHHGGIFAPAGFSQELRDSGEILFGEDQWTEQDGRTVIDDPVSLHDALAHILLAVDLMDGEFFGELTTYLSQAEAEDRADEDLVESRVEKAFLLNLDAYFNSRWMGDLVLRALSSEQMRRQYPHIVTPEYLETQWRQVGRLRASILGQRAGEDAYEKGLQVREHCVALGAAALQAQKQSTRPWTPRAILRRAGSMLARAA